MVIHRFHELSVGRVSIAQGNLVRFLMIADIDGEKNGCFTFVETFWTLSVVHVH